MTKLRENSLRTAELFTTHGLKSAGLTEICFIWRSHINGFQIIEPMLGEIALRVLEDLTLL